jgi:hypothetical protein
VIIQQAAAHVSILFHKIGIFAFDQFDVFHKIGILVFGPRM